MPAAVKVLLVLAAIGYFAALVYVREIRPRRGVPKRPTLVLPPPSRPRGEELPILKGPPWKA